MTCDLLSIVRGIILDMDGVLWSGNQPIGDLPSIFHKINELGLKVTLATNNATMTVNQFLEKLARFGVQLEEWQIVNSALATAQYLSKQFPDGGAVYIVGESGIVDAAAEVGFHVSDDQPVAVLVGLDRQLTYEKLFKAALLIRSGVRFIATNADSTIPTPDGLAPGAGAIVSLLETASDVKPLVIGKPSPTLYTLAIERMGLPAEDVLVVGDRLDTDIVGAYPLGCRTALVLSGATTSEMASQWLPQPDCIANSLSELLGLDETIDNPSHG